MNTDIRLKTTFFRHPKTIKLIRRLGLEGIISIQKLWFWVAENKPDGLMQGGPEDIEIAAEWNGEANVFYDCLIDIRFLIKHDDETIELRNWKKHNPWAAGAQERSLKAKKAACAKHKKSCKGCKDNCDNSITSCSEHASSTAPSPFPFPLPSKKNRTNDDILNEYLKHMPNHEEQQSVKETLTEWIAHRREHKMSLKSKFVERQAKLMNTWSEALLLATVNKSLDNAWAGLFPEKVKEEPKKAWDEV
jgi:hypothetical protein